MSYNPQTSFDPGIIERSGARLTDMLTKWGDQRKQDATEAVTLRKLAGVYDPENKDKYSTMSLDELRGEAKAHALRQALTDQAQTRQLNDLKIQAAQGDQTARAALEQAVQGAGSDVPAVSTPGPFGGPVAPAGRFGNVTVQSALRSMSENPASVNAPQSDNYLRVLEVGDRANKPPKGLTFLKSPSGADIALSPDTGAFQYDPFSKAAAQTSALAPRDALKTYNDNQERISALNQRLKMAKQPDMAQYFDADTINAELLDLQGQQSQLRPLFGGKASVGAPPSPAAATYKSAEEVRAAYQAKKIDRDAAKKILAEQFGLK